MFLYQFLPYSVFMAFSSLDNSVYFMVVLETSLFYFINVLALLHVCLVDGNNFVFALAILYFFDNK